MNARRREPRRLRRGSRAPLCDRRLRGAALALLAFTLLGPVDPVASQEPTPTAKDLWESYPLHSRPDPGATATPFTTAAHAQRVNAPAPGADTGGSPVLPPLLAGFAVAVGALALWTLRAGRGDRKPPALRPDDSKLAQGTRAWVGAAEPKPRGSGARRPPAAQKPHAEIPPRRRARAAAPLLEMARRTDSRKEGERKGAASPRAVPPDARRSWSAEVHWVGSDGGARFSVRARTRGQEERPTVVAESPLLEWPPAGAAAVQGLADAVAELERILLAEGWTPLPPGPEWYAKRFAWIPVIAPASAQVAAREAPVHDRRRSASPAPAVEHEKRRTGRFRRNQPLRDFPLPFAWPPGSERHWRSEIRWDAGVVNSRFEAVAFGPGEDRGRAVGRSAAFRWVAMNDPDPATEKYQRELGQLRTALEAAGWERVGRGAKWYSARFVWRRTGTPPDHIELPERGASPAP